MRLKVDREILLSFMTSAMLSSTGVAAIAGGPILAGVIDPAGVRRVLESNFSGAASVGMGVPAGFHTSAVPEPRARLATLRSQDSTEAEVFKHLVAKAAEINDQGPLTPTTTIPLGLTRGEETFIVRQIKVPAGADVHYFNVAMDGSGRFVLFSRLDGVGYAFVLDAQRHPVSAAIKRKGEPITSVTIDSIRPQIMRMMAFWTDWAAQNTSVAQG